MTDEGPRGWGRPLHAAVLDATGVASGTTVLDLGCGAGLFARAAADRGARLTGIDVDPAAVALAAAEVPEGVFTVGDALRPPSGPFDVVAAVQLLMHFADPVAVLAVAGRAGAVVAATVWGRECECDIRLFGKALARWLGPRPAGPVITEPDRLRAAARRAGLIVERLDEAGVRRHPAVDLLGGVVVVEHDLRLRHPVDHRHRVVGIGDHQEGEVRHAEEGLRPASPSLGSHQALPTHVVSSRLWSVALGRCRYLRRPSRPVTRSHSHSRSRTGAGVAPPRAHGRSRQRDP